MRGLRIEADAENETADPSEHLRVSVAFHPCGRQGAQPVMRTDRHQV